MSLLSPKLLAGLDFKVLSIERTTARRWWNFQNVISPFSRLWLVLGGCAEVVHHGRKHVLKARSLHLVPAFTPHDCSCLRRLDHYHLHFVARLNTGVDIFSLIDCDFQQLAQPDARKYFRRLEQLYPNQKLPCFDPSKEEYHNYPSIAERSSHDLSPDGWIETNGLLSLMLAPFFRTAQMHEGVHARVTRQFLAVQEYIHRQMQQPITLSHLARVAGLHPTYFSDRFQELVGERPLAYLMRYRLERAQYLLLTTRLSVKEVAFEVGIADPAYFTRAFTAFWKVSPTKYRADNMR